MALIVGLLAWPLPRGDPLPDAQPARASLVEVAKLSGANDFEIITFQILPNLTAYLAAAFWVRSAPASWPPSAWKCWGSVHRTSPPSAARSITLSTARLCSRGMWWWWGPPVVTLAIIFTGLFQMSISLDKCANPRLRGAERG